MIEFINNSWWPISLIALTLIALSWLWSEKKRNKTISLLLSTEMAGKLSSSACGVRRIWRNILFTAAWLLLVFALLRPFSGIDTEERQQSSRDIMVLFDVSNSMNVIDSYGESRLDYGKGLISKLAKEMPGDRFGLMSFAGIAFLECPITSDSYSFQTALDDMNSDKIPLGGTNIEIALHQVLTEYSEGAPHKAIVLISDGEEISGDYTEAAQQMKDKNIKVITVQTGDERKAGSVRSSNGQKLRDSQGQLLTSQADSKILTDVAEKTGGIYLPFSPGTYSTHQLNSIVNHIEAMTAGKGETETISKPREIYQPFLLVAIILLLIRMLIGERRKTSVAIATISLICLSSQVFAQALPNMTHGAMPPQAQGPQLSQEDQQKLNQLKNEEIALIAKTKNESISENLQFLAWYNLGLNLTQQHNILPTPPQPEPKEDEIQQKTLFDRASQAFSTASSIPQENIKIQSAAIHNRAALFHSEARKTYLADPEKAIEYLDEAHAGYRQSLMILPGEGKAAKNLELSYLHKKDAEIAKEMLEFHQIALSHTGQALIAVRAYRDANEEKPSLPEIYTSLSTALKNVSEAYQKAKLLDKPPHQEIYQQVMPQLVKTSANIKSNLKNMSIDETEKNVAEAYKLLGGNPDQPENDQQDQKDQDQKDQDQKDQDQKDQDQKDQDQKDQDQKDQDQKDKDQKNKDQKDQDQKNKDQKDQDQKDQDQKNKDQKDKDQKDKDQKDKNQKDKDQKDKDQLDEQKQEGDFKKQDPPEKTNHSESKKQDAKVREAEALLRKMADTEQKVRENIRRQRAEELKEKLRRNGIQVEPGANK